MVTYMRQLTISDKIYSCRCVLVFAAYSPKKKKIKFGISFTRSLEPNFEAKWIYTLSFTAFN